ncbi:MAG: heat-inducible transcriptional repressor HrcA [Actinobacteria bacterium]|nr:heat-inducible transcriptional repressor HrcA [Actinomycetota bacterium]
MDIGIDSRKERILQAVIQSYIFTGNPVGSRTVADSCGLRVSAATIRNEMAMLESLGLLTQPHTSAGRVPTDIAYRYYVDMLMGQTRPSPKDAEAVERLFEARTREIEGLMHEASLLLSRLTHTAAMVFAPVTQEDMVRHLDMVRLSDQRVMVIVITSRGQVGRMLADLGKPVTVNTVERAARYLDESVSGKVLENIDSSSLVEGSRFGPAGRELVRIAVEAVRDHLDSIEERVFTGGAANIVSEMEHAGAEWVQTVLEAMDKQYFLLDLLKDLIREKHLTVRIGEENRLLELQKCAFVGTSYPISPGLLGSLGVVGPTCMDYARTIGMVEFMAENLGRRLLSPLD